MSVGIVTVEDLVLLSIPDIVRKCRISQYEAQNIYNSVCDELVPKLYALDDPELPVDETFTTGDALIDGVLGGGVRTRKLWELVGER